VKTRHLATEMREAFRAMRPADIQELARSGIPPILIDHFQMVGIARIRISGQCYEPDQNGRLAFISPILVQDPNTPEASRPDVYVLVGNLVDLVSWDPAEPSQWALRTGNASWLGCIQPQYLSPPPIRIWRSPLNWFRARCEGLVILARELSETYWLLSGCLGGVVAEDPEHAVELTRTLERPGPVPRVYAGHCGAMVPRRAA
jgi:hypothetical protein